VTCTGTRVGFPRTLFFYSYSAFWRSFFEAAGVDLVESPVTTQSILDAGVREAVSEACIPIKVYHGHVRELAPNVDYLFVPRYVSMDRVTVFCPKFLGLPELVKSSMAGLPPLLSPRIDTRKRFTLLLACLELGRELGVSVAKTLRAHRKASASQRRYEREQRFRDMIPLPAKRDGAPLRIAVLGYPYEVYDGFLNLDVLPRLASTGVDVITIEMFSHEALAKEDAEFDKGIFWHYSDLVVKAGFRCFHKKDVDGVIHITAFGCGPDAVVDKLLELEGADCDVPFMPLLIDEYSGEAGLVTRLEAFIDMVQRRKEVRAG
jgi:predicted nucleotide-binding protein (sugar kinase/HSP70/actin superfamily)